jgi:hypothetical protein
MLREYQDEIKRLKDQLDATQRGVIIGEDGKVIPVTHCDSRIRWITITCCAVFLVTQNGLKIGNAATWDRTSRYASFRLSIRFQLASYSALFPITPDEQEQMMTNAKKEIVERIVEREVIR